MSHLSGIGDSKILQRKIPPSSRYKNVGARVDTGSSVTRYEKRIEEMQTNYRYRKNELFRRMKVTTFAQLVLQVANISMQDEDASITEIATSRSEATSVATVNGNHDSAETWGGDENNAEEIEEFLNSPRSTLQSVIRGVGEVDVTQRNGPTKSKAKEDDPSNLTTPYSNCPYLLLDVRDRDEFERCHITGAIHYPIAMLSRTMNNFTREILEFKNCVGKIIILYDEDERLATTAATTMVERGFENIFVISGGLKVIGQKIPEGLVNGSLPPSCVPAYIAKRLKNARASGGGEESRMQENASPDKKRFSSDDLDKINHYLDESLIPNDTGSRLSRQSKASIRSRAISKASSMSSSSNFSTGSRRPWK